MTSDLEKRAFFNWQKSSDEHLFSIALLVGLFAVKNEFLGNYKIAIYILLAVLIFLTGWGLIRTKVLEIHYLDFLKDGRYKEKWWNILKEWAIFAVYIIMGAIIIYLAMNIWEEIFLSAFGK